MPANDQRLPSSNTLALALIALPRPSRQRLPSQSIPPSNLSCDPPLLSDWPARNVRGFGIVRVNPGANLPTIHAVKFRNGECGMNGSVRIGVNSDCNIVSPPDHFEHDFGIVLPAIESNQTSLHCVSPLFAAYKVSV